MKTKILIIALVLFGLKSYGQTFTLGTAANFVLFTGSGAVANADTSTFTGDIGSDLGVISGFVTATVTGTTHNADAVTAQAKIDLVLAYNQIITVPSTVVSHASAFGNGETLTTGVYQTLGAGSLGGNLTLDGLGDANAVFIFRFTGAFDVGAATTVTLTNGARPCNVYWVSEGATSIGSATTMKGTMIVNNAAISIGDSCVIEGRMLTTSGAIAFSASVANLPTCIGTTIAIPPTPPCCHPNFGTTLNFVLFTSVGAVTNSGASMLGLDVGSDIGAISGFGTATVTGSFYNSDAITAQAATDMLNLYNQLITAPITNASHAPVFGGGETLYSGVNYIGTAGSIAGTLILDGQGDPNSIFIFRINGAFSVDASSTIVLINGALPCSVFFVAEGAITIGASSIVKGTFLANVGAITIGASSDLRGRLFSTTGAITFNSSVATNTDPCPTACSSASSLSSTTNVSCFGGTNGGFTLAASGGTSPYQFNRGTGNQITGVFANVAAGNYKVTVTDSNGCSTSRNVTITEPTQLTTSLSSSTNVSCFGGTDGGFTVTASGGTSPYQFNRGTGNQTTGAFASVATGNYTLTVTDSNGCSTSRNVTITEPTQLTSSLSSTTNVSCFGGPDGGFTVTASGGTSPYQFNRGTGNQITGVFASVAAGNYIVTVTDDNGCSTTTNVTVSATSAPTAPTAINDVVCAGDATTVLGVSGTTGTVSWYDAASGGAMVNTGTSYIFTPTGSAVFYVEQSVASCASARTPVSVTYNALPTVAINATSTTICSGNNVTLTASGGASYAWSNGDVTAASVVSPAATASFTVTLTDGNGCMDTDNVSINVNITPAAPTAAGTTVCAGNAVVLNTVVSGVVEWFDAASAGNLVNNGATFITPVLNADATYFVQITSAAGCPSARTQVTVSVTGTPAAPTAVNDVVCAGNATTVLGVSGTTGTVSWYDAASAGAMVNTGASYIFTPTGSAVFYVEQNVASCASARTPVSVTYNALPTAAINASSTTICSGNNVTLTASGGASYAWSNGDVTATIVVSPSANTTYQLTATNAGGCTATAAFAVVVLTSPNAAISATGATTFCAGGNVTLFTANGSQFYNWSTGSNASSVQASTSGTYSVTVTSLNGCTATASQVVTVNPVPQALITPSGPTTFCSLNGSVDLVASGGGTYAWSNGSSNASINVTNSGQFTVTVTANVGGCTATANVPVTVIPTPAAPTASNTGAVCAGAAVSFNASTLAGADYLWSGPAGFSTTQQSFTLAEATTANAGTYSVAVTLAGCTSLPGSTTLVVNTLPTLTNAPSSNSPVCEGGDLSLNADNVAGVSYAWRGPNGFNSSNASVTITNVNPFDHSGFYNLLITDNATGCEAELPYIVVAEVNPQPTNIAVLNNGPICNGESIVLTAPNVLNATYLWSGPNGFTSTSRVATATAAAAGSYNVVVSVGGCASVPAVTEVVVNPLPNIVVSNDTSVAYAAPVHLLATGGLYYEWNAFTFLSNANIPNPVALPPVGVMSYTVTGYNEFACANIVVVNITVTEDLGNTDVPNLITPNGDGTNDTWVMPFLQQITGDYTLNIYARGGTLVYSSSAYANDWGGTMEGTALPDGAYWYIIRTVDKEYKGAITVKH